ncbi:MAG: acylphosphatase [Pseudoxanthomonas sp.]
MQARRFLVSGRVRGAFRAATVAVARGLGLSGHVPNLDDGRVEVVCAGGGSEIETLSGWPAARAGLGMCRCRRIPGVGSGGRT